MIIYLGISWYPSDWKIASGKFPFSRCIPPLHTFAFNFHPYKAQMKRKNFQIQLNIYMGIAPIQFDVHIEVYIARYRTNLRALVKKLEKNPRTPNCLQHIERVSDEHELVVPAAAVHSKGNFLVDCSILQHVHIRTYR